MKAGKVRKKVLALLLAGTAILGLTGGGTMQVEAAGQENAYVDTSSYEQLYKLYEDYFKLGIACQAMDHWNDPTAEIHGCHALSSDAILHFQRNPSHPG